MTKRVSRGQNRTFFWKNTLKSCGLNGNLDNVVLIDVDNDGLDDVIVIDAPEGLQQQCEGSRVRKEVKRYPHESIISIDDDDGDDADQPGGNMESGGDLDSDATSSKSCPTFSHMQNSINVDTDECRVVRGKKFGFKLTKCQKSCTWKTPCRNCYGLHCDSKSDSSDTDSSDCEFMEGSSGKLREQWEKASLRRKGNACYGHSGFDGQATAFTSHANIHPNVEVENGYEKHSEEPPHTSSSNTDFEKGKEFFTSFGPAVDDASLGGHMESGQKLDQDVYGKDDTCLNREACVDTNLNTSEPQNDNGCADGYYSNDLDGQQHSQGLSSRSNGEHGDVQDNHSKAFYRDKSGNTAVEHSFSSSPSRPAVIHDNFKASLQDEHYEDIDSTSTNKLCLVRDPLHTQGGDIIPAAPIDIINKREKLKETDEYKRFVEEEWASRQRQLQIQAEEAQRLRKRKKAESLRLLDMQRRQKQRIEEVRETQKKDEENLNLKDKFRTEVRNELFELEKTCIDMASLLRGLGIHVPGGCHPLLGEVNAAYKQALLRFHPDRASRTDIRQQVEAEEKFKLISRMKEKLLTTSCH